MIARGLLLAPISIPPIIFGFWRMTGIGLLVGLGGVFVLGYGIYSVVVGIAKVITGAGSGI